MRNLKELNINERGKPVERAAPESTDIQAFEAAAGVQLPSGYLSFLCHANGGHPELDTFVPIGSSPDNTWAVNRFYFLNTDQHSPEGLWGALKLCQNYLSKKMIPFAADSGGNQLVLDFTRASIPCVKLCIHDENYKLIDVAQSFEEFIDLLSEDPDML